MTPPLSGAQRNLSPPSPATRVAWYCPRGCKPRNEPMGYAQNQHAAMLAGVRHYDERHRADDDMARATQTRTGGHAAHPTTRTEPPA